VLTVTHQELFERYVWAGMTGDADLMAGLFAVDGVFEAPLVAPGGPFPHRLEGREAVRAGMADYYRRPPPAYAVDPDRSRYVLHETADPDVFVAELDGVATLDGREVALPIVRIFRLRDGEIALLRDYFAAELVG
jgi:ketosteroid isomerase-like protein